VPDAASARSLGVPEVLVLAAAFVPIGLLIALSVESSQRDAVAVLAFALSTMLCAAAAAFRELGAERRELTRDEKTALGSVVAAGLAAVAHARRRARPDRSLRLVLAW
jgi:hypothetical protein